MKSNLVILNIQTSVNIGTKLMFNNIQLNYCTSVILNIKMINMLLKDVTGKLDGFILIQLHLECRNIIFNDSLY